MSRAELVARELEREIADDREPGERLGTKEDLRKRFGVAVATVNEAVRLLEMRGMIEARPGPGRRSVCSAPGGAGGASATSCSASRRGSTTYEECLEVRDALEPLIDSHAARYHRASDIREMNRIVKNMQAAQDDPAAFFKCNWALHRRIAELCRNSPLRNMYLALIDFLEYSVDRAEFAALRRRGDCSRCITTWSRRSTLGEGPELDAAIEAHQPTAHQPTSHQATAHQPTGHRARPDRAG